MDPIQERQLNQAAYRQLCSIIQKTYPPGRFLAISGGKIIADAAGFEELNAILHRMGNSSPEVLVVQAGVDYPETVTIFTQEPVDRCDRSERVLGRFVSIIDSSEWEPASPAASVAELDRREQANEKRYTTAEVLAYLEKLE